jgi:hypothetical protein
VKTSSAGILKTKRVSVAVLVWKQPTPALFAREAPALDYLTKKLLKETLVRTLKPMSPFFQARVVGPHVLNQFWPMLPSVNVPELYLHVLFVPKGGGCPIQTRKSLMANAGK